MIADDGDPIDDAEGLDEGATASCPYCGETVTLTLDALGPAHERYVEDCEVCCRPWTVEVHREEGAVSVTLGRDDD